MCEQVELSIGSSKRPSGVVGELVRDLVAELGDVAIVADRYAGWSSRPHPFSLTAAHSGKHRIRILRPVSSTWHGVSTVKGSINKVYDYPIPR